MFAPPWATLEAQQRFSDTVANGDAAFLTCDPSLSAYALLRCRSCCTRECKQICPIRGNVIPIQKAPHAEKGAEIFPFGLAPAVHSGGNDDEASLA